MTEEFKTLGEADMERLLTDERFPVDRSEALDYSTDLAESRRFGYLRPRYIEPISEYLQNGGHPVTDSGRILRELNNDENAEWGGGMRGTGKETVRYSAFNCSRI